MLFFLYEIDQLEIKQTDFSIQSHKISSFENPIDKEITTGHH